jgi:hypothetical protein
MALRGFGIGRKINQEDIPAILAAAQQPTSHAQAHPQPAGSLADAQDLIGPQGGAAYLLSQGVRAGKVPGTQTALNSPFKRYAVNRGGKMLEAHDYGGGDVKYFARKNPAILQAAVQQHLAQGQPGAPAMPNLSAQDEELLRMLLGNNTLRR